ncbi:MAG: DUF72 domain-containing protein [Rhodospirillaceae bacterium]
MRKPKPDIRIGVSGWRYSPWRGQFYPKKLPQRLELAYLSRRFTTVEINGTFYSTQAPESFAAWAEATPEDFLFAVKGPRYITHLLRLKNIKAPLANFFASGVLRLGAKLGPLLWQFPPRFKFDPDRFGDFLDLLPRDTKAAARLARGHDERLRRPAWTAVDTNRPLRHAVEIRDESFRDPKFIALLRAHNVALVCADTVSWPRLMDATADFVYCRLHGSELLYRSNYSAADLDAWARRVKSWTTGRGKAAGDRVVKPGAFEKRPRDVFLYFDNTDKLKAPTNALELCKMLGQKSLKTNDLEQFSDSHLDSPRHKNKTRTNK